MDDKLFKRSNLFLISLDDERYWYRYHHLFAEILRKRCQQVMTETEIHEKCRRASRWFAEESLIDMMVSFVLGADANPLDFVPVQCL